MKTITSKEIERVMNIGRGKLSNNSIIICGREYHIGSKVVLWDDPNGLNGYDTSKKAYRIRDRKTGEVIKKVISGKRYNNRVWNVNFDKLKNIVTQFFLHHSGLYHADATFSVLHNERGLSCHFILDDDGTIYQTLDLKENAWHGGQCNKMSIGIEIDSRASAGRFPNAYDADSCKKYDVLPREKRLDKVNGSWALGYDFNDKQYEALIKLAIALKDIFPHISSNPDFPRKNGRIRKVEVNNIKKHKGFVCHFQASSNKIDPISFDFNRFLSGVLSNSPNVKSNISALSSTMEIQEWLTSKNISPGMIDGLMGPKTEKAIKYFQNLVGLQTDGKWNDKLDYFVNWIGETEI